MPVSRRTLLPGAAPAFHGARSRRPNILCGYQGWRDDDRQVMVRDGDWKLSVFAVPNDAARFAASRDGSLHDLRRDPEERRNRITDPSAEPAFTRLLHAIEAWDKARGTPAAG